MSLAASFFSNMNISALALPHNVIKCVVDMTCSYDL